MSWTEECTESNSFKVKHVEEVRQVLESMGFTVYTEDDSISFITSGEGVFFDDNAEVVLSNTPIMGTNFVGILSYCLDNDLESMLEEDDLKEEDVTIQPIVEYLQEELLTDEYIAITNAGFEGRGSGSFNPFGCVIFITKNNVTSMGLHQFIDEEVKKLKKEV